MGIADEERLGGGGDIAGGIGGGGDQGEDTGRAGGDGGVAVCIEGHRDPIVRQRQAGDAHVIRRAQGDGDRGSQVRRIGAQEQARAEGASVSPPTAIVNDWLAAPPRPSETATATGWLPMSPA